MQKQRKNKQERNKRGESATGSEGLLRIEQYRCKFPKLIAIGETKDKQLNHKKDIIRMKSDVA